MAQPLLTLRPQSPFGTTGAITHMAERLTFQGGPLAGMILEGQFHRKGIEVSNLPKRYPSRVVVEYYTSGAEWLLEICPDMPFTADGNKTLAAEYEFDEGFGYFEFKGWSLRDPPADYDS